MRTDLLERGGVVGKQPALRAAGSAGVIILIISQRCRVGIILIICVHHLRLNNPGCFKTLSGQLRGVHTGARLPALPRPRTLARLV